MLSVAAAPVQGVGRADHIISLYEQLRAQHSRAPSPEVNALFADLVRVCVHADARDVESALADPRIIRVRSDLIRLCAEGESLLENAWAHQVLTAADPHAQAAAFPYLGNYEQLTRLELHALAAAGHRLEATRGVCFIGGGSLPLSAMLLSQATRAHTTVVDRDVEAVKLSRRFVDRLAEAEQITVVVSDATSAPDMARVTAGCDVVVVAALVGTTRAEKLAALRAIGTSIAPGTYVVIRTADRLRALLYPTVDLGDVHDAGLVLDVVLHPYGEVVNSVIVARRH
ncbi:nicotianamine synthase family protein [Micromonospora sp. WMMD980]|uniref:nicotianamine synthase family protein n=1 Tax=Micromonospora sp. WMMD980 TaxID=3016088 RepID=UPI002417A614|nr:nicotianamine synthase family protein [Micromonospora sp. WMMD980]MDG4803742.1 nicotianamine synthase family protein [Micromonospora sp. WMMD980]